MTPQKPQISGVEIAITLGIVFILGALMYATWMQHG